MKTLACTTLVASTFALFTLTPLTLITVFVVGWDTISPFSMLQSLVERDPILLLMLLEWFCLIGVPALVIYSAKVLRRTRE